MGHAAASVLINASLGMAVLVALVHAIAMFATGGLVAWLVYRYLGPGVLSRCWLNLDAFWAASLILIGIVSLSVAAASGS